jgi:hypothetical protein
MGLEIRFVKRPSVRIGIHLIVDDGCEVNLNSSKQITDDQKHALESYNEPDRGKHLFYLNKSVTDVMIEGGPLKLHCPTCGNNYELTPQEYHSAFKNFTEGAEYYCV